MGDEHSLSPLSIDSADSSSRRDDAVWTAIVVSASAADDTDGGRALLPLHCLIITHGAAASLRATQGSTARRTPPHRESHSSHPHLAQPVLSHAAVARTAPSMCAPRGGALEAFHPRRSGVDIRTASRMRTAMQSCRSSFHSAVERSSAWCPEAVGRHRTVVWRAQSVQAMTAESRGRTSLVDGVTLSPRYFLHARQTPPGVRINESSSTPLRVHPLMSISSDSPSPTTPFITPKSTRTTSTDGALLLLRGSSQGRSLALARSGRAGACEGQRVKRKRRMQSSSLSALRSRRGRRVDV